MHKKHSLAEINQHFLDNDKATHKVLHSKQISDDVLKLRSKGVSRRDVTSLHSVAA